MAAKAGRAGGGGARAAHLAARLLQITDGALVHEPLQLAGQCLSRMPGGRAGGCGASAKGPAG